MTKIYVKLSVYDYDYSSRWRTIRVNVSTVEKAKHLRKRLETLMPRQDTTTNHTGGWLQRHFGIYGTVQKVIGIFEETTTEVL